MIYVLKDQTTLIELQLVLLDNETKNPTGITLINVKSIENDSIIHEEFSGESIKLPLKVNSNKTKFIFDNKEA